MLLMLVLLCGCTQGGQESSQTRLLLDTVATITADCDEETLNGAFALCEELENRFSRTKKESEVYRLNKTAGYTPVSADVATVVRRALFYSEQTAGRFDITIAPVSMLWDFENQVIPSKDEIAAALPNVDYHSISFSGEQINLGGKQIDLGAIAKGYIADRVIAYFEEKGVEKALVNLGGNIALRGEYTVGIRKPMEESVMLVVHLADKSAVTAGIDQRCIRAGDRLYHHILDPKTGYGVENELASVTVIGACSMDCDALSTCCMLLGTEEGVHLIENTADTEAVFISREGKVTLTAGLYRENDTIIMKEEKRS